MKSSFTTSKIIFQIIFLFGMIQFGFSQTPQNNIKFDLSGVNYKTNVLSIPNNLDIQAKFAVTASLTNYTFSYQLNGGAIIPLNKPSQYDGNTVTFSIPRKDYNKPSINNISFSITISGTTSVVTIPIINASLSQGNILDDAIAINEADPKDAQLIIDILSFYSGRNLNFTQAQSEITSNTYLDPLIKVRAGGPLLVKPFDITADNFITGTTIQSNGTTAGAQGFNGAGLDVTKYANTLADVMIDHAKEELTIAFFNRFKTFIDKNEEFKVLFPKTTDKLANLLSYKYPEMIKALRAVFLEDIRLIAYKIDDVLALPRYVTLSQKYPEISITIKSLRLIHQLETDGLNTAGILNAIAYFPEWDSTAGSNSLKNFGASLKVANEINKSISFTNKDSKLEWHPSGKTSKLYQDSRLFQIYMGLLYQKIKTNDIDFTPKGGVAVVKFSTILSGQNANVLFFQNKIQEFTDLINILQNSIKDIKNKGKEVTNNDRYTYISNSIDVLQYSFSIYNFFDTRFDKSEDYIKILGLSNDIYKNIYEEDYNASISNVLDLFDKISDLRKEPVTFTNAQITAIKAGIDLLATANISEKKELKSTADKLENPTKKNIDDINKLYDKLKDPNILIVVNNLGLNNILDFVQKIKPYALFMANIVEAKDEKEVKAALDAVILPVGSSTIKKNSDFNFNIQSYLGARNSFTTPQSNADVSWNNRYGISAPVGLSISHGFDKKWGAISLFVPLLDLGAIVDYKLKYKDQDTSTETVESKEYTIKLGQIFSPGAYLVYGFGANIPLSFGIGGQHGPGLSKINQDNSTLFTNPYWRWNMFLSVDIPLFNLSNKAKIK